MSDLHFISEDHLFEILIGGEQVNEMVRFCVESGKNETGGVLAGNYDGSHKCACIMNVSDVPEDSRRGRFTFVRGVRGLQGLAESTLEQEARILSWRVAFSSVCTMRAKLYLI